MHVPNVQPPLPVDWEVHPTHPVHVVPYALAQYWDRGLRQRVEEERAAAAAHRRKRAGLAAAAGPGPGHVPRELRNTAKRTPAVKGWVRVLEEPVRRFLAEDAEERRREDEDEDDVSDEEIVFVGRRGAAREAWKKARREVRGGELDRGVVFDELGDDENGAFKCVERPTPVVTAAARGERTLTDFAGAGSRIPSRTTTGSPRGPPRWASRPRRSSTSASKRSARGAAPSSSRTCPAPCGNCSEGWDGAMVEMVHDTRIATTVCVRFEVSECRRRATWQAPLEPLPLAEPRGRRPGVWSSWCRTSPGSSLLAHRKRVSVIRPVAVPERLFPHACFSAARHVRA